MQEVFELTFYKTYLTLRVKFDASKKVWDQLYNSLKTSSGDPIIWRRR